MNKIEKLKKFLQENYPNIQAFNSNNVSGDFMINVYDEDEIEVDYCDDWEYIEIFGLTDKEFDKLLDNKSFLRSHLKTFKEYIKEVK